jgi:hypothetical protein
MSERLKARLRYRLQWTGRKKMSVFNVVKFRVKPGRDDDFLHAHRDGKANWPGLDRGVIIKTGDRTYCVIGEWADTATIAAAREKMIATLNTFRETLEDQGGGLGVTDAASGSVVLDLKN